MDIGKVIEENIVGRQTAETLMEMALDYAANLTPKARIRFYECIQEAASKNIPKKLTNEEPMTDKECRTFGDTVMEFGMHKGAYIDAVPLEYIEWLLDQQTKFSRQLKRYLHSKRIQQERR